MRLVIENGQVDRSQTIPLIFPIGLCECVVRASLSQRKPCCTGTRAMSVQEQLERSCRVNLLSQLRIDRKHWRDPTDPCRNGERVDRPARQLLCKALEALNGPTNLSLVWGRMQDDTG